MENSNIQGPRGFLKLLSHTKPRTGASHLQSKLKLCLPVPASPTKASAFFSTKLCRHLHGFLECKPNPPSRSHSLPAHHSCPSKDKLPRWAFSRTQTFGYIGTRCKAVRFSQWWKNWLHVGFRRADRSNSSLDAVLIPVDHLQESLMSTVRFLK